MLFAQSSIATRLGEDVRYFRYAEGLTPENARKSWLRPHSPPFKGEEAAQRRGGLVKGRVASLYACVAILILFEITNHPVCAAKERDLLIEAQPPLLEKEGNGAAILPERKILTKRSVTVYLYRYTLYR